MDTQGLGLDLVHGRQATLVVRRRRLRQLEQQTHILVLVAEELLVNLQNLALVRLELGHQFGRRRRGGRGSLHD